MNESIKLNEEMNEREAVVVGLLRNESGDFGNPTLRFDDFLFYFLIYFLKCFRSKEIRECMYRIHNKFHWTELSVK